MRTVRALELMASMFEVAPETLLLGTPSDATSSLQAPHQEAVKPGGDEALMSERCVMRRS